MSSKAETFLRPVLEAVEDGHPRTIAEISAQITTNPNAVLPDDGETAASEATIRVSWARTALVKAGLLEQAGPSSVQITDAGEALLRSEPGPLTDALLVARYPSYARWFADMGKIPEPGNTQQGKTVWLLRAGRGGVYAPDFVRQGLAVVGWGASGDVSELSREEIEGIVRQTFPSASAANRRQAITTLFRMVHTMAEGDLVITPEPASRTILLGRVIGEYRFLEPPLAEDYRHARPVRWFGRASRDELSYGARNSLGSLMTLSRPSHPVELWKLAGQHEQDEPVQPKAQVSPLPQDKSPERVGIPQNAAVTRRAVEHEFQTNPMSMLQLLDQLETGQIALPDFQRSFVWSPGETRELLVSIFRSFPAGALLFLQRGDELFKARPVESVDDLQLKPSYLVLDGQQRLTSLYQALRGGGQSRFFLDVGALIGGSRIDEAVRDLPAEKAARFKTKQAQADALMLPLAEIRQGGIARWSNDVTRLRGQEDTDRLQELLYDVDEYFVGPLLRYRFPVTILPESTELEAVCTIFETLNRTGKPLTPFELISARVFADGLSLFDRWNSAVSEQPVLSDFDIEPYYLLQLIALRLGRSPKRSIVLQLTGNEIAELWDDAVADMAGVARLLRDECGVLVAKWLPYRPMLIPLAFAWREVTRSGGPQQGAMRAKLKRWFWCQCFTGDYESSSLSFAERDAPALRTWLTGDAPPPAVAEFEWNADRWRSITSRQQGLYKATIALILTDHPRDFHTGARLTREVIEANKVDDHHIFPRAYLRSLGRGEEPDTVLNHTLIDRTTNLRIGKRPPSAYLAEIRDTLDDELDAILSSHRLPSGPDSPLTQDDFEGFIEWRLERLKQALVVQVGQFKGPQRHLPPHLRSLDLAVEQIELELRELVIVRLGNDLGQLPSHIIQRATDRAASVQKREPGAPGNQKIDLTKLTEFLDLRELQEAITSRQTWPLFAGTFSTKELLATRFGQLADLRNAIRHSRTVSEVTIKDGQAALLWFEQALTDSADDAGPAEEQGI